MLNLRTSRQWLSRVGTTLFLATAATLLPAQTRITDHCETAVPNCPPGTLPGQVVPRDGASQVPSTGLPPIVGAPSDVAVPSTIADDAATASTSDVAPAADAMAANVAPDQSSLDEGSFLAHENMIDYFFQSNFNTITVVDRRSFAFHTFGTITAGSPGGSASILAFEADNSGGPDDFTTLGNGTDTTGDSQADQFSITEPLAPNEVPTSPGSSFTFDGGTVVYTQNTSTTTAVDGTYQTGEAWYANYSFSQSLTVQVPGGGAVRRLKLSENNSPIPQCRLNFSYNFFNDVFRGIGDVDRYTVGVEATFLDSMMSLEVRTPFAGTFDSVQTAGGSIGYAFEFGDVGVFWKVLLMQRDTFALTSGVGLTVPTAADLVVNLPDGRRVVDIENESWHALPFVAALWAPRDRFYSQTWVQWDLPMSGSPVLADPQGIAPANVGTLTDAALMHVDWSMGYVAYENPQGRLSRITPTAELHYTTSLQDADRIVTPDVQIAGFNRRVDLLNLTVGSHFRFGKKLTITPAIVLPMQSANDRAFDYEAIVQANCRL